MRIGIGVRYPYGACSYYRTMGVFSKLYHLDKNISVKRLDNIDWSLISDIDILYLERPQDNDFYIACKTAKEFNVKLWIDYDDDLFNIPSYNPCKHLYENKDTREIIEKCLKLADVVTVTTETLKELYSQYNDNVVVIENAFNDYNYTLSSKPGKNKIITWRGSNTHRGDLIQYSQQIVDISHAYFKDWAWSFIGNDVWYITDYMKSVFTVNEMSIPQYFNYIKKVPPMIQISPLILNQFNKGKSNISWIEGIYSGAAHVGPDMPEFNKPGIETYKTPEEFKEKLKMLIDNEELRDNNFKLSYEYICGNLLLSEINKKRIEVAEGLLDD